MASLVPLRFPLRIKPPDLKSQGVSPQDFSENQVPKSQVTRGVPLGCFRDGKGCPPEIFQRIISHIPSYCHVFLFFCISAGESILAPFSIASRTEIAVSGPLESPEKFIPKREEIYEGRKMALLSIAFRTIIRVYIGGSYRHKLPNRSKKLNESSPQLPLHSSSTPPRERLRFRSLLPFNSIRFL